MLALIGAGAVVVEWLLLALIAAVTPARCGLLLLSFRLHVVTVLMSSWRDADYTAAYQTGRHTFCNVPGASTTVMGNRVVVCLCHPQKFSQRERIVLYNSCTIPVTGLR